MITILGLETSCDETAAAVVRDGVAVLSNVIATQHELHRRYGGVVPEIASRAHLERLTPVVEEALSEAKVTWLDIDAVAVGNRPGLIGSLLVGVSAAQALAWSLGRPLVGVDHVHAHLHAAMMRPGKSGRQAPAEAAYPALGLVVSGGHTSLYLLRSATDIHRLGATIDDAVGEAYDKAAVILELGYPGGPKLDQLARTGDPTRGVKLPRSLLGAESLDFSFSGLKTAMLYAVRGHPVGRGEAAHFTRSAADLTDEQKADLAAGFQQAAVGILITKLGRALDQLAGTADGPRSLLVGGGVSANSLLREQAVAFGKQRGLDVHLPPMSLCMDNAAMIAGLACEHLRRGHQDALGLAAIATTALD
ncbi:MAG: tRNA (adenosine(37)-N6)-threonylcarbamoyltransferase complex transferase subunit TsaD [Phycisphaeraceae bacterium]|nr:tRNA (adenosine(37)-N6)-threonylcarbamoyltransferase complex transferase subunit TsaD [Phycisphaeraceae bacterium]